MYRTMGVFARRLPGVLPGLLALSLGFVAPAAAQQAAAPAAPAPAASADAELRSYAKAFVGVGLVRDEYEARLALVRNKTVELQAEIRKEMKEKVNSTIRSAGLTPDGYRRIEYSITVDPARRAAFDQLLLDLAKAG
jgi:hypothetical protein